jgi:hypothetical protein
MTRPNERWLSQMNLRSWFVLAALLVGVITLGDIFGDHYPVHEWLFWRYLRAWLWVGIFCVPCLSVGNLVVRHLSRPAERHHARITLSFATGVFVFALAVFVVGIVGQLGTVAFFSIPTVLTLVGAPRALRDIRAWPRAPQGGRRFSVWEGVALGLGILALAIVWVPTLVPENASYDSRWYHLPLAERYVADSAILRFPEGALAGTIPQLASLLYTWAFLAPGSELFDKVITASQLEVAVFLFTLPGISALLRQLVPDSRPRIAWVFLFLFPSILVYDSSLVLGADHIAALWTIPTYLVFLRAYRDLNPKTCALFAVQVAALAMTKYTALIAAVLPLLGIAWRAGQLFVLRLRGRDTGRSWFTGPLTMVTLGLLLTTPHWLKNWIWYGDPAYPMLHRYFRVNPPWSSEFESLLKLYSLQAFAAAGSWSQRLKGMLGGLYDFSYGLYNWDTFHGSFPVFGSAFTFSLLALPFLRNSRRVWTLVVATELGVAVWYLFFHQERYLQSLLPWMAAAVAAIAILAWREGLAARTGIVLLLGLQLIWGAEFIFWPMHQVMSKSGLALAGDFFQQTWHGQPQSRTAPFEDFAQIGRSLPKNARVLLHHEHMRLGLGLPTITDAYRTQYGISYGDIGSPLALHRLLRKYGVTHVVWTPEQTYGEDSAAGEFVFHAYVERYLVNPRHVGGRTVAGLPEREPIDEGHAVLCFTCDGGYEKGLYELSDLRISPLPLPDVVPELPRPRAALDEHNLQTLLARASFALVDPSCSGAPPLDGFSAVARAGRNQYFVREHELASKRRSEQERK